MGVRCRLGCAKDDVTRATDSAVLVTGANGFVGRALAATLSASGVPTRCAYRTREAAAQAPAGASGCVVGEIGRTTRWAETLIGVDTIVHLAARVHMMADSAADGLAEYRRVNLVGTVALARAAVASNVRRFVFVSSVKVNGDATNDRPFRECDEVAPAGAYGLSKWEAEQELRELARSTGLEVVIVRPPLVYGPGVRANFRRLVRLVGRGIPLPFGLVDNRRSMIALDNLVNVLVRCSVHPAAPGQTFLVSDGEDLSTPALIRRIAQTIGVPARLLPVPPPILRAVGRVIGRGPEFDRVLGSLQVDSDHARKTLDWSPPVSVDQGLRSAVLGV